MMYFIIGKTVDSLISSSSFFFILFYIRFCFSVRKGNDELPIQLSKIIIPIYCLTVDQSDDERRQKLVKVEIFKKWISEIFMRFIKKRNLL